MAQSFARFCIFALGIFIAVALASVPYLKSLNIINDKAEVRIRDQIIIADIAHTDATREKGLSGREKLGVNEGMVFVFDEAGKYPFWMKGMKFPIDIVWIDADYKIVGIEGSVNPQIGAPETELISYVPPVPVKRVIELASGRAKLLRASVGDDVRIRPLVQETN